VPLVAGEPVGPATLPSLPLPASGGYRLPLRRGAMARVLAGLAPDLIESGDPYRVAWAARDAARRRGCAAVAYCHSNLASMARLAAGPRFGATAARWAQRYARRVYDGFDLVLAPSRSMAAHLADWGVARVACQPLGVDTRAFHPTRADRRGGCGTAGRRRRACSSTPGASLPRSTSMSSLLRSSASARPTPWP
jgi:alpha-1,6-mannosyltransferase